MSLDDKSQKLGEMLAETWPKPAATFQVLSKASMQRSPKAERNDKV